MADTIKEKVAVVGMAAKFPQGADSVSSFWNMLCEGRSARTVIPQDRFDVNIYYSPDTERLDTVIIHHCRVITTRSVLIDVTDQHKIWSFPCGRLEQI